MKKKLLEQKQQIHRKLGHSPSPFFFCSILYSVSITISISIIDLVKPKYTNARYLLFFWICFCLRFCFHCHLLILFFPFFLSYFFSSISVFTSFSILFILVLLLYHFLLLLILFLLHLNLPFHLQLLLFPGFVLVSILVKI